MNEYSVPASPLLHEEIVQKLRRARPHVDLGRHRVGEGHPTYFIAEIGNNHNGDYHIAKKSIEEAARAGAHAVKLQKRFIEETFARELRDKPQTKQVIKGSTYGEYREGLELSLDQFIDLKNVASSLNVDFFATPFDKKSVDFLEEVGVLFYKIASFDVTNLPLLDYVARKKKPVILSTGMATLEEVDEAVNTILEHNHQLILLHCVSIYPSPDTVINLGAMDALRERYKPLPVGYSGHEQDILPTLTAVARGAAIVERHFTLSTYLPGPDHESVSIAPPVFAQMVADAQRMHAILGAGAKVLLEEEIGTRNKHSKSIVACASIPKGALITKEMLTCKSPGYGIKPRYLARVIGKTAARDIASDSVITEEDIDNKPSTTELKKQPGKSEFSSKT